MNTVKDKSQTVKNVCIKKQEKNTDKIYLKSVHFRKRLQTTQQKVRQKISIPSSQRRKQKCPINYKKNVQIH